MAFKLTKLEKLPVEKIEEAAPPGPKELQSKLVLPPTKTNKSRPKTSGPPPHFSNSQLSTWLACGKKYKYKYIDQIPGITTLNMASGSAIHQTLEYNAKHKLQTEQDMDMEMILDTQADAHDKFMDTITEEVPAKAKGKDKDESLSIVKYYKRVQAPKITPVTAEYPFTIEVEEDENGKYKPIIGFIDSVSQLPDIREGPYKNKPIIVIEDYKKGRRKPQAEIDYSTQLTLYDHAFFLATDYVADAIGYRQLGFNGARAQEPGPYVSPIYRSPDLMEPKRRLERWKRVLDQIKAVQRAIQNEVFIPTDDARVCSWCDYVLICQDRRI